MRPCSGDGKYTPLYRPALTFPVLPQWVGTLMSHPVDIWGPCLPSTVLPVGGNPQGPSSARGSLPMSRIQTEAPLAPLPHNIPMIFLSAPFLPHSFTVHPHFHRALHRFCSTAGQSSLENNVVSPKYLNKGTTFSRVPYAKKTLPIRSSILATSSLYLFLSEPH